ncbi:MAG: DUF2283 domain-containing protein [bacterium]
MRDSYLEITFRHGKALAAYYYLPRSAGDVSVRTEPGEAGMLVDFARDGRPIGIEITTPSRASLAALNRVLRSLGQDPARREDFAPLRAA